MFKGMTPEEQKSSYHWVAIWLVILVAVFFVGMMQADVKRFQTDWLTTQGKYRALEQKMTKATKENVRLTKENIDLKEFLHWQDYSFNKIMEDGILILKYKERIEN